MRGDCSLEAKERSLRAPSKKTVGDKAGIPRITVRPRAKKNVLSSSSLWGALLISIEASILLHGFLGKGERGENHSLATTEWFPPINIYPYLSLGDFATEAALEQGKTAVRVAQYPHQLAYRRFRSHVPAGKHPGGQHVPSHFI